ncbi:MAG: hypothetical protein KC503_00740 [Myxococcales bacterium]|nr:hypothetical protein [Myxococcales bacterium]
MSATELLHAYGAAFWKTDKVDVSQRDDRIRVNHPGFYESVDVRFDDIGHFNDVDAAVLMSCKPTGRHGYVSAFRREVLVRACGDPLSEHIVASGVVADLLADVTHGELRYRLGPASTVMQVTFSHLYPLDWVDMSKEYSILVEPSYVESIRDDDLTRRLAQMGGHRRLRALGVQADQAIDRFLIELSAVLRVHLKRWDVPETLEFAFMENKRKSYVEDPGRVAQVFPYVTGVDRYLRALQVNEPYLRIFALIQVIEAHYTYQAYEETIGRLRSRIGDSTFDAKSDDHILELISMAARAHSWREKTVEILASLIEEYVELDEMASAVRDLLHGEAAEVLVNAEELSRWVHDLRQLVSGESGIALSRLRIDPERISDYLAFIHWLTVTIMRGNALREELVAATTG